MSLSKSVSCFLLLVLLVFSVSQPLHSQRDRKRAAPPSMPALNVVQTVTLGPPYSCDPGLLSKTTALFLSDASREGSPELLFNGACGATDYFDVNTSGDDMSLIADLGAVPLASVTAHAAFNLRN